MTSMIIVAAIALFVILTISKGVRIVPQGEEWIVERLGRYHSTLKPGLNFVIPYMDVVAYRLPTKDIILEVQQQEIITKDNAVIVANALCFAKVVDLRIPRSSGHPFHKHLTTDSTVIRPPIPRVSDH